jgi:glyoxylase-like metal-dependent hydrolase (beta-lactamase superfamily II)
MAPQAPATCARDAMGQHEKICETVFLVGGAELSDPADCLVYALDLGVPVLIDCGCGPSWGTIRDNVRSTGVDPAHLHTLVLTHAHVDHAGAAARAVAETRCRVVAHELDAAVLETGDPVRSAADWYGVAFRPVRVDHRLTGTGETLRLPRGELRLIHAPGHTPGSIVAVLDAPEGRVLFGQDVHGPFSPAFGSDLAAWRRSVEILLSLDADVLCEGHFGVFRGRKSVRRFIESQLGAQSAR